MLADCLGERAAEFLEKVKIAIGAAACVVASRRSGGRADRQALLVAGFDEYEERTISGIISRSNFYAFVGSVTR